MRFLSERQTGGPKVANSHAPKAWGQGYGAAGPMLDRCAPRTPFTGPAAFAQTSCLGEVGGSVAAAPNAQAQRAWGPREARPKFIPKTHWDRAR